MKTSLLRKIMRRKKLFQLLIFFMLFPFCAFAQSVSISGTITDESGETMVGVSVVESGTQKGTVSDIDGKYQITVASNATLTFSYLGYQSITANVKGRTVVNVTLKEDLKTLNEVVVIGYGTMKKSDLTGAVTSVKADAIIKSVPTSVDQVLQGRAAGVQVVQNSGMPGAASSVRIRGVSSINSTNEPIYVVDGIIISQDVNNMNSNILSSINPSDIVSVDILKDASATAIYGSRASNGVIIITTRRGESGNAVINFNSYLGWQQIPKYLDVLDLRQYAEHRNLMADHGLIRQNNNFVRPDLLGEGTNWQKELFQTALMQNYNLSFSGGNDKSTYNLAAGYLNQEGIAQGSGFERYNLTGNFDAQVKPWIKVGTSMAFSNTFQQLSISNQSLINAALRSTPDVPVRNADGSFSAADEQFMPTNPIAMALLRENEKELFGLRGNAYTEIAPQGILKGLKYRFEFAFDYNLAQQSQFLPTYSLSATQFNEVNQSDKSKQFNKYWTYRNILTYDKTINDIHKLTVMMGQEYQRSSWDFLSGTRSGFQTNSAHDLTMGEKPGNDGYSGKNAISSQFGRLFYSLQDIYLLTATIRHDGTSKFAPEHRWGWFPSAAFAWRVSEYNFLKDREDISNLKLRLGWGLVGNQGVPTETAWYAVYRTVMTPYGTGLYPGNTPNPVIQWETTASTNIGIDLSFLKNRIEVIFDWYNRKTDNILLEASLPNFVGTTDLDPSAAGASSKPWVNLGSLQNRGIEFTVNTQNIITKDFKWNTNLIFSSNRNKVLKLNTATSVYYGMTSDNVYGIGSSTITSRTAVGAPIGQLFGYQVIGRFENATDFYRYNSAGELVRTPVTVDSQGNLFPVGENSIWIGDYIYKDQNNDGKITSADCVPIGNPEPKFTYGIGNTFSYKNVDLTIFFNGSYGNDVVHYTRRFLSNPYRNISNLFTEALDYAQLELINANGPNDYRNVKIVGGDPHASRMPLSGVTSDHNSLFSDRFVEDGSFLRLQNISIGYTLPRNWLKNAGISQLKLYANLQNVYTWTKYSGYDPEVGTNGIDNARYPSPRIYTFGLNLTF